MTDRTATETCAAIDSLLRDASVAFSTHYAGETTREDNWECDAWRVSFAHEGKPAFLTDYYTGLGHRKQIKPMPKPPYRPGTIAHEAWKKESFKPVAPHAADVLQCLLFDAQADDMSFRNWCEDYGYDNDSIKALNIYNECCATAKKLREVFTREQLAQIAELVQEL